MKRITDMDKIFVSGSFDDICCIDVRFLEESAEFGPVQVLLWSDEVVRQVIGKLPKFTVEECRNFIEAVRFAGEVVQMDEMIDSDSIPLPDSGRSLMWVVMGEEELLQRTSTALRGYLLGRFKCTIH